MLHVKKILDTCFQSRVVRILTEGPLRKFQVASAPFRDRVVSLWRSGFPRRWVSAQRLRRMRLFLQFLDVLSVVPLHSFLLCDLVREGDTLVRALVETLDPPVFELTLPSTL